MLFSGYWQVVARSGDFLLSGSGTHSLDDCVRETCRLPSQLVGLTSVKMLAIPTAFQKQKPSLAKREAA